MSTALTIATGDVIEYSEGGVAISALVLLAASGNLILDLCDGSTPFVVLEDELIGIRVFEPELAVAA